MGERGGNGGKGEEWGFWIVGTSWTTLDSRMDVVTLLGDLYSLQE